MSTPLTDSEIIRRVLNGSTDDFRELVLRHQRLIFALIIRQVGEEAVASDIAQEVFLRAFTKLGSFRGEASFSTWLVRIALNLTHSYFSSREYRERNHLRAFPAELAQPDFETADLERRLELLREAVASLEEKHREVIALCALERRSYEEAAEILNLSVGTVRSRLNTARNRLRVILFGEHDE